MIELVEVRTVTGDLLSLPLEDVETGLLVVDIDGLDPVEVTISSSEFASMDGAQYQSSRRATRDITFKFRMEPDYLLETVRDLRKKLYDYFMPKSSVDLRFYLADGLIVDISGRVKNFSAPLFTSDPQATIVIECFNPDFSENSPVEISGETVSSTANTAIDYPGTVQTGFVFTMNVNRSLSEFSLYLQTPDDTISTIDFAANLEDGDVLTISTVRGDKYVKLNRAGVENSLLYGMSSQSTWPFLMPGENEIRVYSEGDPIPYTVTYTSRYGGL